MYSIPPIFSLLLVSIPFHYVSLYSAPPGAADHTADHVPGASSDHPHPDPPHERGPHTTGEREDEGICSTGREIRGHCLTTFVVIEFSIMKVKIYLLVCIC